MDTVSFVVVIGLVDVIEILRFNLGSIPKPISA